MDEKRNGGGRTGETAAGEAALVASRDGFWRLTARRRPAIAEVAPLRPSIATRPARLDGTMHSDASWLRATGRWLTPLAAAFGTWLPARCALCARPSAGPSAAGAWLCNACDAAALPGRNLARCLGCALPLPSVSTTAGGPGLRFCAQCSSARPGDAPPTDLVLHPALEPASDPVLAGALDAALAAVDHAPPVDRLILAMKRGQPGLAAPLGALAAEAALRAFAPTPRRGATAPAQAHASPAALAWLDELRPDAIVPMPLSASALAARGFNQSLELARPVARRLGAPLAGALLRRVRDAAPQKSLQAAARAANLAGAFAADATAAGRRVLLLDDVMTTGATLREAAWTLKDAGATSVVGLVVARVP